MSNIVIGACQAAWVAVKEAFQSIGSAFSRCLSGVKQSNEVVPRGGVNQENEMPPSCFGALLSRVFCGKADPSPSQQPEIDEFPPVSAEERNSQVQTAYKANLLDKYQELDLRSDSARWAWADGEAKGKLDQLCQAIVDLALPRNELKDGVLVPGADPVEELLVLSKLDSEKFYFEGNLAQYAVLLHGGEWGGVEALLHVAGKDRDSEAGAAFVRALNGVCQACEAYPLTV